MKKLFFILMGILAVNTAIAQKVKFCDPTNIWTEKIITSGLFETPPPIFLDFHYTGDTTIDNKTYLILDESSHIGLVREDTMLHKVFYRTDTGDQVLYDYNLNVGDTFLAVNGTVKYKVTSVDSTLIRNVWHKVWFLKWFWGNGESYWVTEGIGSSFEPLFPIQPYTMDYGITLVCFSTDGAHPYLNPKVGDLDNNESCTLGVSNIQNDTNARLFPNPLNKSSIISLPYMIANGSLIIINDVGQTVYKINFKGRQQLPVGDKITTNGVYFYSVTDNKAGKIFTGKFIR